MIERNDLYDEYPKLGDGNSAGRNLRLEELDMEQRVSEYLRELPFLRVNIDDEQSPERDRTYLERNAIALESNDGNEVIDPCSNRWLGNDSPSQNIRDSGLWDIDHVDESYAPAILDQFAEVIEEINPCSRAPWIRPETGNVTIDCPVFHRKLVGIGRPSFRSLRGKFQNWSRCYE